MLTGGSEEERSEAEKEAISDDMNMARLCYTPLRGLVSFGSNVSMADIRKLVDQMNTMED